MLTLELLKIEEVAELLRVSRHTVYRLAARGELPGRKIGRHWRFVKSELMEYLQTPFPTTLKSIPIDGDTVPERMTRSATS